MNAQDYYAYGDYIRSYTAGSTNDKYKYTGKERDTESNYDYFGARYYDSELGRWMSADPLAMKNYGINPYNYAHNNPLRFVDPNGMDDVEVEKDKKAKQEAEEAAERERQIGIRELADRLLREMGVRIESGFKNITNAFKNVGGLFGQSTNDGEQNAGLIAGATSSSRGLVNGLVEDAGKLLPGELKYLEYSKGIANTAAGIGVGISLYQFSQSSWNGSDYARLGGSLVITASGFIPAVGPYVAISLGIMDSKGTFDSFYKSFNK